MCLFLLQMADAFGGNDDGSDNLNMMNNARYRYRPCYADVKYRYRLNCL